MSNYKFHIKEITVNNQGVIHQVSKKRINIVTISFSIPVSNKEIKGKDYYPIKYFTGEGETLSDSEISMLKKNEDRNFLLNIRSPNSLLREILKWQFGL